MFIFARSFQALLACVLVLNKRTSIMLYVRKELLDKMQNSFITPLKHFY
jgi:hypothetical protein